jgi:sugar lactone lactonase YvrE
MTFGPDGNLYASSDGNDSVLRYDGTTGAFSDVLLPTGSGGLKSPEVLIFQNDGFLYASNFGSNPVTDLNTGQSVNMLDGKVTRYSATTGQFDSVFAQSSDIRGNCDGMAFGRNGNLFVCVLNRNGPDVPGVLQFDGTSGALMGQFTQGGNLHLPRGLAFGPDGNLYVADIDPNDPNRDTRIARFDGSSGQYLDDYIPFGSGLLSSRGMGFGPDGRLYLSSLSPDQPYDYIYAFDGTKLRIFIDGNADGSQLTYPHYFVFH